LNLAHDLPFPFASDLFGSPSWQGILRRDDNRLGRRAVEDFVRRPRWELYDLEQDPHELVNLAADPARAEVLKGLQAELRRFQEETADPWLVKYRHE
jgi:N-sulfoglucosamine sulfohydrolase